MNAAIDLIREDVSMVAHNLRNPLACIVSTLELLETKSEKGIKGDISRELRRGLRAAERMESMLARVLESARQQATKPDVTKAFCSLNDILGIAVEQNAPHAQSKAISIQVSGADIMLNTDAALLVEAVDNLISNAIKYSPSGTTIRCKIGTDQQSTFLRVIDQGKGLSRADLQRVGQPFQQLSAKPTAGESSTGLGLWSVRRIASALGGRLFADSAGKNTGATFTLTLPFPT